MAKLKNIHPGEILLEEFLYWENVVSQQILIYVFHARLEQVKDSG
jgi:plasmid maintenance system antidote protein VapI